MIACICGGLIEVAACLGAAFFAALGGQVAAIFWNRR